MTGILGPLIGVFALATLWFCLRVSWWLRHRGARSGESHDRIVTFLLGMAGQQSSAPRGKAEILNAVLGILALPVTVSLKAIIFGNKALRIFVVLPSLVLMTLFCTAEVSGWNALHWLVIFWVIAVVVVALIELPLLVAIPNVFKATRKTVGVVLARTFLVVLLLSLVGVATPLHELQPLYLRVLIVIPLAVILPVIGYLQWADSQPRTLIWRPWFLLLMLVLVILVVFSLAYRQSHNELPLGVERIVSNGNQSESQVVAIHQDRLCSGDSVFRYSDNAFQVRVRHDCWSDMVYLPATVSTWKMTVDEGGGCVRLWFPSQSGDYVIAGQRGDYFSCAELQRGANSYQGRSRDQFRVRKSSTGSTAVLVQWE